jgi:integrase
MAPRPRQRATVLPAGIKGDALPVGVYWDPSGRGRWLYKRHDKASGKSPAKRLAGPTATLREIWDAYEAITRPEPAGTLSALVATFEQSTDWADLAESTRRDYRICAAAILGAVTKAGTPVRDTRPADWTPGAVRSYVDRRAESSRSRANHELRYLRRLFAWAYERDQIPTNPARGVKTLKEASRNRYVAEGEYIAFLTFVAPRFPYLVPLSELAYLCRLRVSEVCDLKRADITPEGLFAARRKGSKDALTGWTPRLKAAVEGALSLHGPIASLYLIPGPTHGRMSESTIQTAWQRSMVAWAQLGNERFTIHDLKRAGISDAEGDKLAASGHRSIAMLKVYDVLPSRAPATR